MGVAAKGCVWQSGVAPPPTLRACGTLDPGNICRMTVGGMANAPLPKRQLRGNACRGMQNGTTRAMDGWQLEAGREAMTQVQAA